MIPTFQQMVYITTTQVCFKSTNNHTHTHSTVCTKLSQISIKASIILATKLEAKEPVEKRIYMFI